MKKDNDEYRQRMKELGPPPLKTEAPEVRLISLLDAEGLARLFHETYEKLAPQYGYETREESRTDWQDVPDNNKQLMIATCRELLSKGI
jgi:hypothetical protein